MTYDGETVVRLKYHAKDGKWLALVEPPNGDAFVVEDRMLGKTLAQVTLRLEAS